MADVGRPTELDHTVARFGALKGCNDEWIASVLRISIAELAQWAWDHESFFNAITPTDAERKEYVDEIESARAKRRPARNALAKRRYAKNHALRLTQAIRSRMWAALKGRSDGRLFSRLGYSIEALQRHLEGQFKPGMAWENYGKWHVDHIKPCAAFDLMNPAEFEQCWALENLQPLWAQANFSKGSRHGP